MHVQLANPINTDRRICDAARISMSKLAESFEDIDNRRLLKYLAKNRHWSPFGHARLMFAFEVDASYFMDFFLDAQLAGFTWASYDNTPEHEFIVNGSLWAWYENLQHFPAEFHHHIMMAIKKQYPWSFDILFSEQELKDAYELSDTIEPCIRTVGHSSYNPAVDKRFERLHYHSFLVRAPIYVARQMVKHQIHLCWNEESRRYIDTEPTFFTPKKIRKRPDGSIKQGSGGEHENSQGLRMVLEANQRRCVALYNGLIASNVAPEQARSVLPLDTEVNWMWTGSVEAWRRVVGQRLDSHAQEESRDFAAPINEAMEALYPDSWHTL